MLTQTQIKKLESKILSEQVKVSDNLEGMELDLSIDLDERDDIDKATIDLERSKMIRFRNREVMYEKKLAKALDRINSNEFGDCVECGDQISFERLFARPTAELCITCKDEAERDEKSSFKNLENVAQRRQVAM